MSQSFGHLTWQTPNYPEIVVIEDGIINEHGHPRNPKIDGDGRSELIIRYYQEVYGDVFGIGNTLIAITTIALAYEMKKKWQALSPWTRMHVVGLLTENSVPEEIVSGYDRPDGEEAWVAMKMFLRAVSNAHGADVDNIENIMECLRAMTYTKWRHKKKPMRLKIHCERKYTLLGRLIPVMDRERIAFMRDVEYLFTRVPDAEIQICHVSDGDTIEAIRELRRKGFKIYGEISPHYTEYVVDDLFEDEHGAQDSMDIGSVCLPSKQVGIVASTSMP
jgi:dihydroorotase